MQERKSSVPCGPSDHSRIRNNLQFVEEGSVYDGNLSMATNNILDKYGLRKSD